MPTRLHDVMIVATGPGKGKVITGKKLGVTAGFLSASAACALVWGPFFIAQIWSLPQALVIVAGSFMTGYGITRVVAH